MNAQMSTQQKKQYIKKLFKTYHGMDMKLRRSLEMLGIRVEISKKHIKLYYEDKLFICPRSPSDFRSGRNLATVICHKID